MDSSLDIKIRQKRLEVNSLEKLLDNARRDLRNLEAMKKAEEKKHVV